MIRKTFYFAGALSLVTMITVGLILGTSAKSTTSAAAATAAVQSCNFSIPINNIDLGPRKVGGGHDVKVVWAAPNGLPNCVSVEKYTVTVTIKLPNRTPDKTEIVAGNLTSATLKVLGTPLDRDPQAVTATVVATLKTVATAKGTRTDPVKITP
ncbi:MAG TPA: hypothetical protein VJ810_26585 [Blastocatellia bacterium]|nr:hypothetical protein [Blastocatellia bacterium]